MEALEIEGQADQARLTHHSHAIKPRELPEAQDPGDDAQDRLNRMPARTVDGRAYGGPELVGLDGAIEGEKGF